MSISFAGVALSSWLFGSSESNSFSFLEDVEEASLWFKIANSFHSQIKRTKNFLLIHVFVIFDLFNVAGSELEAPSWRC